MENYKFWVARDRNGQLCLYEDEPERSNDKGVFCSFFFYYIPSHIFPDLTWEDEPIKVELRHCVTDNEEISTPSRQGITHENQR
jgi:hypothetical protein